MKKKLFTGLVALCMAAAMSVSAFAASTEYCSAGDCGYLVGAVTMSSTSMACGSSVTYNPNHREVGVLGNAVNRSGVTVASTGYRSTTGTEVIEAVGGNDLYAAYGQHTVNSLGAGVNTYTNINL